MRQEHKIEKNVSSSNKFRGGEIDTRTAGRRGEWSKESRERGAPRRSEVGVQEYRQDREDPELLCSSLIAQHLANSGSHVRTAAQEFGRTDAAQMPGRE